MTNFSLDNHLKYRIGGNIFGHRTNHLEKFVVSVGKIDPNYYNKSSYREELRRTADIVYRELGKDLVIFLSGGTDSEIVVRNFLEIGVKPRCVTIKFDNGYNEQDVQESINISTELDIKLDVIGFDIKDFYFSGQATEFGQQVQCTQLAYLMVYHNIRKLSLPAVMGGEVVLTKKVEPDNIYWYYTFRENEDASAMRFSDMFSIPLVNEWFTYTPELLLYYLEDPDIQALVSQSNYKITSVSSKNAILRRLYPEVRLKTKTHGFEKLLGFNALVNKELYSTQIMKLEGSLDGIPYNDIITHLKG